MKNETNPRLPEYYSFEFYMRRKITVSANFLRLISFFLTCLWHFPKKLF